MKIWRTRHSTWISLAVWAVMLSSVLLPSLEARVARILSDQKRDQFVQELDALLVNEDPALLSEFPFVVNPYFFEQPLLLRLRAPGGLKDTDILESIGQVILTEVSGAFVTGNRRSLMMKNGELIRIGDTVVRSLEPFGGLEARAKVADIFPDRFVLELNNAQISVDLSGR